MKKPADALAFQAGVEKLHSNHESATDSVQTIDIDIAEHRFYYV